MSGRPSPKRDKDLPSPPSRRPRCCTGSRLSIGLLGWDVDRGPGPGTLELRWGHTVWPVALWAWLWPLRLQPKYYNTTKHTHYDVMENFPRYWPYARGIHKGPVLKSIDYFVDVSRGKLSNKHSSYFAGSLRRQNAHVVTSTVKPLI